MAHMEYTVGRVAAVAGVSIRTLHHYDELGLVVPHRSESGYRVYTNANLDLLQQVLFYRKLGFSLADVAAILTDPSYDRTKSLRRQREHLMAKRYRYTQLVETIDKAIDASEGGREVSAEEKFAGFDEYAEETKARWGDTDEYAHSRKRLAGYDKHDVETAQREADDIAIRFGELKRSGADATEVDAVALAEEHRLHIDKWWYPCPKEMHDNLGAMYVQDAKFTEFWAKHEAGLAEFVRDAIHANAGS